MPLDDYQSFVAVLPDEELLKHLAIHVESGNPARTSLCVDHVVSRRITRRRL
jgi:hypothetical protein